MFITSMGMVFIESTSRTSPPQGEASVAKIERITDDIARFELLVDRTEKKIAKLENETNDSSDINAQIDAEQQRMDNAYAYSVKAIDEQMEIIRQEQSGTEDQVKSYTDPN